jgi:TorA maturation chaperone TorD
MECAAYLLEQPCDHSKALLQELWHEHLVSWVPGFSAALQAESRLQFYQALGSQLEKLCGE